MCVCVFVLVFVFGRGFWETVFLRKNSIGEIATLFGGVEAEEELLLLEDDNSFSKWKLLFTVFFFSRRNFSPLLFRLVF